MFTSSDETNALGKKTKHKKNPKKPPQLPATTWGHVVQEPPLYVSRLKDMKQSPAAPFKVGSTLTDVAINVSSQFLHFIPICQDSIVIANARASLSPPRGRVMTMKRLGPVMEIESSEPP